MNILAKVMYKFNGISIKIKVFTELENIQNSYENVKTMDIAKAILSRKNIGRCITLSDFKLFYTSVVTRTEEYWHKNKHVAQ